jgi:hypothetical protein
MLRRLPKIKVASRTRIIFFLVVFIFMLTNLSGCILKDKREVNEKTNLNENTPFPIGQNAKKQPLLIAVFYLKISDQDEYLVREVHKLPDTKNVLEAALQELILGKPLTPGAYKVLSPQTKILGITVEDGLATVNFSRQVLTANVGSKGEALGIQSIVNTLTEFSEIQRVSFLVEGKLDDRTRDWWGHVGLYEQPFKRDLTWVFEPAIWVTHPVENQVIGVPLFVKGSARVFEGAVICRLLDAKGKVLVKEFTTATCGAPGRGDFELRLSLEPSLSGNGRVEVFWESPKDGSEQDKIVIPIRWSK